MQTTRLSTRGQTGDGILLRPASRFPDAKLDEVAGCLRSKRKSITPAQVPAT